MVLEITLYTHLDVDADIAQGELSMIDYTVKQFHLQSILVLQAQLTIKLHAMILKAFQMSTV
ncbi:25397_t:CDS:2, partial [Racocetra persica]